MAENAENTAKSSDENGSTKDMSKALATPGFGWTKETLLYPQTHDGLISRYLVQRRYIQTTSSWTRIGENDHEFSRSTSSSLSGTKLTECLVEEARVARSLISQLCENFYQRGWATGTGGGISIRTGGPDENRPWRVFVAPSGVQKEDMIGEDVFELDMDQNVVVPPKTPGMRLSACTPLWYIVYKNRPSTRSVIHTHSMYAQLATLMDDEEDTKFLRITHLEMLKGIGHHAYDDILEVPIIDNRPTEDELAEQLETVINKYPKCNAVLVRRHVIYVWGDSWEQAKTQCESFDYLFETCVKLRSMGIDFSKVPKHGTYRVAKEPLNVAPKRVLEDEDEEKKDEEFSETQAKKRKLEDDTAVKGFNAAKGIDNAEDFIMTPFSIPLLPRHAKVLLLDIEGCTTAISFVKEVLFPYVLANLDSYVDGLNDDEVGETLKVLKEDIEKITDDKIKEDCSKAAETGEKDSNKEAMTAIVKAMVKNDVKATGLKSLQGKMWKAGYASGELKGHVYPDFKMLLEWCQSKSIQVNIYSSGSVAAQKLLFSKSIDGDLTIFLANYFDTTSGPKKEAQSYKTIAEKLGVSVDEIIFVSDAEGELVAARDAGIKYPVMSVREGNAKLTDVGKAFPRVYSLMQLCGV